jgi:hypothetical protein
MKTPVPLIAALVLAASTATAEAPIIERITQTSGRFSVTLSHPDTGWDHYADGWRIELADGTVLGTRELVHPHVDEQPFTRSTSVNLPDSVTRVFIRARCNLDGWNADAVAFELN